MSPYGGDERVRTDGLLLARQALSQLSYTPVFGCDQLSGLPFSSLKVLSTPSKPYSTSDTLTLLISTAPFYLSYTLERR